MTREFAILLVCGVIVGSTIVCGGLILMTKAKIDRVSNQFEARLMELFKLINDLKNKN